MPISETPEPQDPGREAWTEPPELGHPRGTLAIVILYAVLFAAGWLALYFGAFLPRGMPQ